MDKIVLTEPEFEALLEYSTSLPTGTSVSKRWKRAVPPNAPVEWWMGEYVPHADPKMVGIKWYMIVRHSKFPNQDQVLVVNDG